jgi:hypothetical protein
MTGLKSHMENKTPNFPIGNFLVAIRSANRYINSTSQ